MLIGLKGEKDMTDYQREISKEIYDRAMEHGGCVTEADKHELFSEDAIYGYGVYGCRVKEICGKYIMTFSQLRRVTDMLCSSTLRQIDRQNSQCLTPTSLPW
jgi:hypothetical protein